MRRTQAATAFLHSPRPLNLIRTDAERRPDQGAFITTTESKIIFITGASSGIGEATARHLAATGHQLLLGARRVDRLAILVQQIEAAGRRADFHELDVTSLDSVLVFAGAAQAKYGQIDAHRQRAQSASEGSLR